MSTRKNVSGFSLIETFVTMGMLMVLLGAVYAGFSCGLRFFTRSQGLAHLQQEAQVSMDWMARELSTATLTGSQVGTNSFSFASAFAPSPNDGNYNIDSSTGALMWQKWVCYLSDPTATKLIRSEVAFTVPVTMAQITVSAAPTANLGIFQATPQQRTLTNDLESFAVTTTLSSVKITLILSENATTSQPTRIQLDDEIHIGNQ